MNEKRLNGVELRLIAELMKNSRRSDRELAKALGVSQPTISRIIRRLEKEGTVQEYTMIPNFAKLGYEILAMTFVKLSHPLSDEEIAGAKKLIMETMKETPLEVVMLERGMGMDFDGVIISYHTDYASHMNLLELLRGTGLLDVDKLEIFRVNLRDEVRFIPLTYSLFAQCIPLLAEERGKP